MKTMNLWIRCIAAAVLATATISAVAQTAWPNKPLRVILPFPPGSPSDIVLRSLSEGLHSALGQPVVIENKPGAGGSIGAAEVARAPADGYTWLWTPDTVLTINPHVYRGIRFGLTDFTPVSVASSFSQVLVCHPSAKVSRLADLIDKARTENLSYASGGNGVPGHMAMEMLLFNAKVDMTHVPYKGPSPATQDVLAGTVPCGFLAGPTVLPHIQSGRLVALAISGQQRSEALPSIPTVAEAGYPDYDATFMSVMLGPKGLPPEIAATMSQALITALRSESVRSTLQRTDQRVVASSPTDAASMLQTASRRWADVARRINLTID
jgi:tripartite-type tricarboxylate transporter receptor subunit TctC